MRVIFAVAALACCASEAANAADFLYTFSGTVTYANNIDSPGIYANEGDPIAFSLLLRDTLPTVTYTYEPTRSSAIGGSDFLAGTQFPVDRRVHIDPALGYGTNVTPLATGFRDGDSYSASFQKNAVAKSLFVTMAFENFVPPAPDCQERCSGTRITHYASAQVYSDAFTSPDFRETGTFELGAGTGTLGDGVSTFLTFNDFYELSLSRLTVEPVGSAVPELDAWLMMLIAVGWSGAALRRRQDLRSRYDPARAQ